MNLDAAGLHLRSCFKDRAGLHFGNLGKRDPKPATAMTQHRIEFVQLMHAARNLFDGYSELIREFILLRVIGGQKLVQRWIQKTGRGGENTYGLKKSEKKSPAGVC